MQLNTEHKLLVNKVSDRLYCGVLYLGAYDDIDEIERLVTHFMELDTDRNAPIVDQVVEAMLEIERKEVEYHNEIRRLRARIEKLTGEFDNLRKF